MIDGGVIELNVHVDESKIEAIKTWPQPTNLQQVRSFQGARLRTLGAADHAESHYRIHTIFMVYGAEAVLPYDIIHDSPRVRMYEEREAELDR